MNALSPSESFRVAVVPTVKVASVRDLEIDKAVSGTIVSCNRIYSPFFHQPVWNIEVALDGGLQTNFGCKKDDIDAMGGKLKAGQAFKAVISAGIGPGHDELDVEPSRVWYLKDMRPGAARIVKAEKATVAPEEMACRAA